MRTVSSGEVRFTSVSSAEQCGGIKFVGAVWISVVSSDLREVVESRIKYYSERKYAVTTSYSIPRYLKGIEIKQRCEFAQGECPNAATALWVENVPGWGGVRPFYSTCDRHKLEDVDQYWHLEPLPPLGLDSDTERKDKKIRLIEV